MSDLILIGAGEHARVVADAARLSGWNILGAYASEPTAVFAHLGGNLELSTAAEHHPDARFHVAFAGRPGSTRRSDIIGGFGLPWATVVHPSASISTQIDLGLGVYIGPRAIVNAGAIIGDHAIINSGAIIEHDVRIGAQSNIGPGAVIGGGAVIGYQAVIALGALVRDHITVGDGAVVGMGAAAVRSVDAGITVVGVPARPWPG